MLDIEGKIEGREEAWLSKRENQMAQCQREVDGVRKICIVARGGAVAEVMGCWL